MEPTLAELLKDLFLCRIALSIFQHADDVIFYGDSNSTVVEEIMSEIGIDDESDPINALKHQEQILIKLVAEASETVTEDPMGDDPEPKVHP